MIGPSGCSSSGNKGKLGAFLAVVIDLLIPGQSRKLSDQLGLLRFERHVCFAIRALVGTHPLQHHMFGFRTSVGRLSERFLPQSRVSNVDLWLGDLVKMSQLFPNRIIGCVQVSRDA
jgi:hypothetical protein